MVFTSIRSFHLLIITLISPKSNLLHIVFQKYRPFNKLFEVCSQHTLYVGGSVAMDNHTLSAIGARLAEVRRSHGVTQEALADMLGVSPKHISHTENATSCLSLKNLIQFCTIFECSLDYLIMGSQNHTALSRLPNEIITILYTGSEDEINLLNRYLQIYIELKRKQG